MKKPPPVTHLSAPASAPAPSLEALKIRFGTRLTAETLARVHRASYWGRQDITDVVEQALAYFFTTCPGAQDLIKQPLPEAERLARNLPKG